jgi:D-lactate dehydrogenase
LFEQFHYKDAIIFGHAKEGNLHFLLTQPVNTEADLTVFEDFNEALADLIIHKYGGSLKAEHGTGRQIAPFVLDEWGEEIYSVMEAVKQLLDPAGILNPGVLLSRDRKSHLQHIKTLPAVEEEVDKCVECGYCENRCPSRSFTLTPRQRIQLRRAMQRLGAEGDTATLQQLQKEYQYAGMDTCAVDGMCATDCPVSINTGELIKRLRRENHSALANRIAVFTARYFGGMEWLVKLALRTGNGINRLTGRHTMHGITAGIKKIIPAFPLWTKSITKPVSIQAQESANPDIVYFPSCITRMMGTDATDPMPMDVLVKELCQRAGLQLKIADDTQGVCCGQLYSSKGFLPAYRTKVNEAVGTLWQWTNGGQAPVLMDVTSCTHSLHTSEPCLTEENKQRFHAMQFIDSIEFAADYLLPRLQVTQPKQHIVFHPVCTSYKMQQIPKLKAIARACAVQSDIPAQAGCCGMAGDRGFYYPGLTGSATKDEAGEVLQKNEAVAYDGCYSSGKTCEMAMQEATGLQYRSVLYLLRDTTDDAGITSVF